MNKQKIIDAASGAVKADLVLKNAQIINVFSESFETGDVAITDGYIVGIGEYSGTEEMDMSGMILAPGFMDGHMHFESCLITPPEFEKAALPRGTTAVIADPHEIANVAGADGIDFMLEMAENMKLHAYYMLPSCVPSCPLEETGHILTADKLRPYYGRKNVLGLAEVMNSPGVLSCDDDLMEKINDAQDAGGCVDGHAPGLSGHALNAYIAAGVGSDHECTAAKEAREKLRRGQWIMIREGTAAENLEALLPLCKPPYWQRCFFVTDDRHPEQLLTEGHIDAVVRKAVSLGVPLIRAIKMCTYNTAMYFGLREYGAIAPGYRADIAAFTDPSHIDVKRVFIDGKLVAEEGRMCSERSADFIEKTRNSYPSVWRSFNLSEVRPHRFMINKLRDKLRVITLQPRQLLTGEYICDITEKQREANGIDLSRDIIKAAVIERHHNTGHIGVGFIKGYGLRAGAVGTSVAHDSHNLIIAGTDEQDMAIAAERIREMGGGLIVVEGGEVLAELALPVGGIMSALSVYDTDEKLYRLKKGARALGVSENIDPFMTLSFVSLPVIPKLRLNGMGLIDVDKFSVVDVTF